MARTLVVSDNFNRAGPGLGANWLQVRPLWGDMTIQASTVVISNTSTTLENAQAARWNGAGTINNDQYAAVTYVTVGGIGAPDYGVGVIARASTDVDATRDFYYFIVKDDGTAELGKQVNGTQTVLNGAAVSWASGDVVALECEGTTIRACKGVTPLGGAWTVTDASLASGGVGVAGVGQIAGDNFEGGNMGEPPLPAEGSTRAQHSKLRRPGRGPYSKGAYKRPSLDVLPQTYWTVDSDAVTLTDSATEQGTANVSDSVAASDSADSATAVSSSASDALAVTDSATQVGTFSADAADSVSAGDSASSGTQHAADLTPRPRPGRGPYSVGRYFRPRLDVLTNAFPVVASDAVAANDSASTTIVAVAAASDAVAATDSANHAGVVSASASDSVSATDSAASTTAGDRTANDAVNAGDTGNAVLVATLQVSEAVAASDTASAAFAAGGTLFAVESITPSDAASTAGSVFNVAGAEIIVLLDTASTFETPRHDSRKRIDHGHGRVTKWRVGERRL